MKIEVRRGKGAALEGTGLNGATVFHMLAIVSLFISLGLVVFIAQQIFRTYCKGDSEVSTREPKGGF